MRLNDYTLCMAFGEMPCYLWMEGMDKEVYTEYFNDIDDDNTDYEKYEWDFEKHCVKKF